MRSLAGAVGARDQHRYFGAGDPAGQLHRGRHGPGFIDHPAQVMRLRQTRPLLFAFKMQARRLAHALRQLQQILHGGQQPVIVPGLGHIVGGAGLHQLHRRLQMGPGGEQDDGKIRMIRANVPEQCYTFLAGGGICTEVHVGDDQIDAVCGQRRKARLR